MRTSCFEIIVAHSDNRKSDNPILTVVRRCARVPMVRSKIVARCVETSRLCEDSVGYVARLEVARTAATTCHGIAFRKVSSLAAPPTAAAATTMAVAVATCKLYAVLTCTSCATVALGATATCQGPAWWARLAIDVSFTLSLHERASFPKHARSTQLTSPFVLTIIWSGPVLTFTSTTTTADVSFACAGGTATATAAGH
eukprot:SAG31_NODE_359_length_17032_cov_11.017894_9_plen_199_part_00